VAETFVLDTSAILTLTGNEAGADDVHRLIADAIAARIWIRGSFVTLTEVQYITMQEEGEQIARQRLADIIALPIAWLHSDTELCGEAAALKATHRMSFADAFVAATAKRFDAILVHKDPEFLVLNGVVRQSMLPPKSGPAVP
jgi:predicted nucleic acid-binding protein